MLARIRVGERVVSKDSCMVETKVLSWVALPVCWLAG